MKKIDTILYKHGSEIKNVFSLYGDDENDITFALGYLLSHSQAFLKMFVRHVFNTIKFSHVTINLQEHARSGGFTDIELILDNKYIIIVEAKKGWVIPEKDQILKYLPRLAKFNKKKRAIVVLSENEKEYFYSKFPRKLYNTPVFSLSYSDIIKHISFVYEKLSNIDKFLLSQFEKYLKEAVVMENWESSWVYVVSLADGTPKWCKSISWKDIINVKSFYFYPNEKNWPKVPPIYVAFRYHGKLNSIHRVNKYAVVDDVHKYIPEIKRGCVKNHFLLWLDDGFEPRKELPNGKIWTNARLWCMLDTLFTCKTVQEAVKVSWKREKKYSK